MLAVLRAFLVDFIAERVWKTPVQSKQSVVIARIPQVHYRLGTREDKTHNADYTHQRL